MWHMQFVLYLSANVIVYKAANILLLSMLLSIIFSNIRSQDLGVVHVAV